MFDNTAYTVTDLEPMIKLFAGRVQQFVFTSSIAVYKRSFIQPIVETSRRHSPDVEDPRKSYGVDKVQCEDFLLELHERMGLPATVLRVAHTLGPRSPLVTREPMVFRRLEERRPILVPGEGFPFVHLVHVQDVANCMAAVVGEDAAIGEAFNVSGDEFTSVEGCIHLMARAVGVAPEIIHVPLELARRADPPLVHWAEAAVGGAIFSNEKARSTLHWTPNFGLQAGYRDSYTWYDQVGRDLFEYDFSGDDRVLAELKRSRT